MTINKHLRATFNDRLQVFTFDIEQSRNPSSPTAERAKLRYICDDFVNEMRAMAKMAYHLNDSAASATLRDACDALEFDAITPEPLAVEIH